VPKAQCFLAYAEVRCGADFIGVPTRRGAAVALQTRDTFAQIKDYGVEVHFVLATALDCACKDSNTLRQMPEKVALK
jgi:hypothetical protein